MFSGNSVLSIAKFANLNNIGMRNLHHSCKILVVGGGTGGCTMAAKFAKEFKDRVIIVEPSDVHYYQPIFTLVGGGISSFESSHQPMKKVLPQNAQWIKDSVVAFEPVNNNVTTSSGDTIQYDIMIVAMGLQIYWNQVPGLLEAIKDPESQVCSIYSPDTVTQVYDKIKKVQKGKALFTYPNSPVKCPGAPQKIAYIAEDYWRKRGLRENINVAYNTALPVIFGVKPYADALWEVCDKRGICVNLRRSLVRVDAHSKMAFFENLDKPGEKTAEEYSFLHVCPPMGSPEVLKKSKSITNDAGFLSVCAKTLQHDRYSNIYGLGDCTSTPNSKTMAAIASQSKVLYRSIKDDLAGKPKSLEYTGYASCPLVTGYGKCILAEFDYNLQPMETFPVNQKKELYIMYLLKKHFFPFLYWNLMLKGYWSGPETFRKLINPFSKRSAA